MNYLRLISSLAAFGLVGCAHQKVDTVSEEKASRIDRQLVRETIVFEPGSKLGAVPPDVSAPRLHALWVDERVEGSRLIEAHREWILEGDVSLLSIPAGKDKRK